MGNYYSADAPKLTTKVGVLTIRKIGAEEFSRPRHLYFNDKPTGISNDRLYVIAIGRLKGKTFLVTSSSPDWGATTVAPTTIEIISFDPAGKISRAKLEEEVGQDGEGLSRLGDENTQLSFSPDGSSIQFSCGKAGNYIYDGKSIYFTATTESKGEDSRKSSEWNDNVNTTDFRVLKNPSLSVLFVNILFLKRFQAVAGDRIATEAKAKVQDYLWMETPAQKSMDRILATGWVKLSDLHIGVSTRFDGSGIQGFIIDKEPVRLDVFGVADASLLDPGLKKELARVRQLYLSDY